MSETITFHALDLSGETTLKLFLRKDDGTLLNTGGDALQEIGSSGVFTATLAESRTGLGDLSYRVCQGTEIADNLVDDGFLPETETTIGASRTAVLDSARDQTLADLANMITGSGTVDAKFDATALSNAPSGTGGDATLAKQNEILAAIEGSQVIQVASPNVSGNLVLTQGDNYDGVANPKATWTVTTDYTSGWSVALTIRDVNDVIVYSTSGTVASATSIQVAIACPTGLTMTGCPGQWQGKFDVELTKNGSKKTIALGVCYINEDQTR